MTRLRSNEWNFSSNAAARISEVLGGEKFQQSPLGHAEAELAELMGARRLDLVIFDRGNRAKPLITGELKVPWSPQGRTPHNSDLLEDAHRKASNCGAKYFITWNIRRAVVWKTDDPGVPLPQRVIYDRELIPVALTKAEDLGKAEFQASWRKAVEEFTEFLHQLVTGPVEPTYLPLDRQFIARLESLLDFPIEYTAGALATKIERDTRFKRRAEAWMRDRQGWVVSPGTMGENIDRAARFSSYLLVNRLCFYNALRQRWQQLPRLTVNNRVNTGELLKARLIAAFDGARDLTGDYDTVFEFDAGDDFPFLSDDAVPEWRNVVRSLDAYDFATIPYEIIGQMYEQLISPEERHRYGQHYTQPAVVDLINAFSIQAGDARVLDPACGGGTFLVRAYGRKNNIDDTQDHTELLATLYGCDLLQYACHLSIINLAIRDLIDDENYPVIHHGDFLDVTPDGVFAELPTRIAAGGLPTGTRQLQLADASCHAVVGNPPYIQARQIPANRRTAYLELAREEWPDYPWDPASDILVWFFTHSARFVRPDGYLSLLTQAAWLDVEYGVPLQRWMMENFRVIAVLETEAEPWFSDARVATVVAILARDPDTARRDDNVVRFVQFRQPLRRAPAGADEATRQAMAEDLRDAILRHQADATEPRFRVRVVRQGDLYQRGVNDDGNYVGTKWGRYLRTIDVLYELQRDHAADFCTLRDLAEVVRGVTTNADDFFIVSDITQQALDEHRSAGQFQNTFGVRRGDVTAGRYRIVRRDDGVELPLEAAHLIPTLKTARDVNHRTTSAIANDAFAVHIPAGPRNALSRVAQEYIRAGEREHWHESPSFNGRADWYVLRETETAPVLFVKTIQYAPQVFWNDAGLLANQRLYNIDPHHGVDPEVLVAMLNSTIFAAERFAGVKALGREAANDVEVFTARQFKVPDVRRFSPAEQGRLRDAFRRLRTRQIRPLLEETLTEAGLNEARVYADQHPVSEAVWPAELRDPDRQEIDKIILRGFGLSADEAEATRSRLYNELVTFTRKAKLLELEAQVNRRGGGGGGPAAAQLADDLWADLTANNQATVRTLPDDFLPPNAQTVTVNLPAGRVTVHDGDLFADGDTHALKFGRDTLVEFETQHHRDLALLLAENRVRGDVTIPCTAASAQTTLRAVRDYLADLLPKIRAGAAEITENEDLQTRIINEALKRLLPHR